MERQKLTPQFFEAQIAQLERERSELEDDLAWWREGYERFKRKREARSSTPDAAAFADGSRPSLRSGIQIVMGEAGAQSHWRVADLLTGLQARGWQPKGANPRDAIAAMVADMKKKGEIYWVTRGVYALTPVQHQQLASSTNGAEHAADKEEA